MFYRQSSAGGSSLVTISPDNAAISQSDYAAISVGSTEVYATRPIVDGSGYEYATPGVRLARYVTDAATHNVKLRYRNVPGFRSDVYSQIGAVYVGGALHTTFSSPAGINVAADYTLQLSLGSTSSRTFEIIAPYSAPMSFMGLELPVGASLSAASARPTTRFALSGDSITQGFTTTGIKDTWAFKLAAAKSWQMVNMGYGGRICVASDGTALGALGCDVAMVLIGYNDFAAQTPLATFKTAFQTFVTNFRTATTAAGKPNVKLHCLTLLYTSNTNTLTPENYRTQIRDALTAIGDAKNVLIEGAAIITGNTTNYPDGIHPGDTGAGLLATALASSVSV